MEVIEIGEPVRVEVVFERIPGARDNQGGVFPHHKIRPRAFRWQNREYPVEEITYVWREAIGDGLIYHFAVLENGNIFELCFDNNTMDWTLASVARE